MNRILTAMLVFILASGLLITGCTSLPEPEGVAQASQVGKPAPDFKLLSLEGSSVSLSDFRGQPTLINFWASWREPCRDEMSFIQEIYMEWTGKSPSVAILAINLGESSSRAEKFMRDFNLSFPVLLDTKQEVAAKYNIRGIPTTFFIDKDGIIQYIMAGAFSNTAEIEANLDKIMY